MIESNERNILIGKAQNSKTQNSYWNAIFELRKFVDSEMINKCFELINSKDEKSQIIGIDVLSQLGKKRKSFSKQLIGNIFNFLKNSKNEKLIISCLIAIGHNNKILSKNQIKILETFKNSKSKEVRYALVFSILTIENETAINILIKLSDDKSPKVRDWSLFALGTQINVDNKQIREILYKHCSDKDPQAKQEALKGLSNRNDERIDQLIIAELGLENINPLLFETIMQIKYGERFLPELKALQKSKTNSAWILDLENCIEVLENNNVA